MVLSNLIVPQMTLSGLESIWRCRLIALPKSSPEVFEPVEEAKALDKVLLCSRATSAFRSHKASQVPGATGYSSGSVASRKTLQKHKIFSPLFHRLEKVEARAA